MARRIASVVGGLVVLLAALLTAPTQAAVAAAPTQVALSYGYDGQHRSERPADAVTERGPPWVNGQLNIHDAVSNSSHESLTRPEAGRPYGYDTRPQLAQVDNTWTTTWAPAVLAEVVPDPPRPGGVAANAGDDLTRVGRWMSQSEYDQMVKSSRVIEGGGGRTYVVRPPNPETYKPGKGVYAEFDVPTSSLHPAGGNPNYAVIPGPNAGTTRFGPLPTQMPRATCIELVCRR